MGYEKFPIDNIFYIDSLILKRIPNENNVFENRLKNFQILILLMDICVENIQILNRLIKYFFDKVFFFKFFFRLPTVFFYKL